MKKKPVLPFKKEYCSPLLFVIKIELFMLFLYMLDNPTILYDMARVLIVLLDKVCHYKMEVFRHVHYKVHQPDKVMFHKELFIKHTVPIYKYWGSVAFKLAVTFGVKCGSLF